MIPPADDVPAASTPRQIPLKLVLTGISSTIRWNILIELLKGEALPVQEISNRLKIPAVNASKHMLQLFRCHLVERTYNRAYRIPAHFLVPGQQAVDFGHVYLRLDESAK